MKLSALFSSFLWKHEPERDPEMDDWNADFDRRAAERAQKRAEQYAPKPVAPLTAIGRADQCCPNCSVPLDAQPTRKFNCQHCGRAIHVKTRPLDGLRVLLTEHELPSLEEEWARDYEIKARTPKQISPEWAERIEQMRKAGPSANPLVEAAAQRIFQSFFSEPERSPVKVVDEALAAIEDEEIRDQVAERIQQLQVQFMG